MQRATGKLFCFGALDANIGNRGRALMRSKPIWNNEGGRAKSTAKERNIISQHAVVEVPGQRGGNIIKCAAITHHDVIHHYATLGSYKTAHLITFLDNLHNTLIPPVQIDSLM